MQMSPTERRIVDDCMAELDRYQNRINAEAMPVIAFDAKQSLYVLKLLKRTLEETE